MEAKDTVKECDDNEYCQPCCHNHQAEISFKAGMKEVVDWIENNNDFDIELYAKWQAFRKERGLWQMLERE